MTLESYIDEHDCQIEVTHYVHVKGSYSYNAASDVDYYGYTEVEFAVLDMQGNPAPHLEALMTEVDRERIEGEIIEARRAEAEDCDDY